MVELLLKKCFYSVIMNLNICSTTNMQHFYSYKENRQFFL